MKIVLKICSRLGRWLRAIRIELIWIWGDVSAMYMSLQNRYHIDVQLLLSGLSLVLALSWLLARFRYGLHDALSNGHGLLICF
jgi:hypothetical protein